MKFVMTGHKGLIGNSLLERLIEQEHEPILLIDKRDGNDILDLNSNMKLRQRADMMIHLASFCKINKCIENPEIPKKINDDGTFNIVQFCRTNQIPKIVFTSSSRVLSKEENAYTASKIAGEKWVRAFQHEGLNYVIIRPSTVYGPFNDQTKRLIDIWILNALQEKELPIYGDKNKTLDFTYVSDFVDGMLLAMQQKNSEYNISGKQETNLSNLADFIIDLAGKGEKRFYPAEIAQPQKVNLDNSAIEALGYKPKIDIYEE